MTLSKPPDVLRRVHDVSSLKRRLTDIENQAATTQRPKQRKRLNRAAHADESIPNPQTIEERTREKGRQFLIEEALFLVDTDVFTVDEDEDFDVSEEFASDKNKIQGQLRQFTDGMSSQRSSTSNRLRGASLAKIVDDIKPFETSSGRFNAFAKFIGHQPGTETSEPFYSKLDVPVLYDGWHGKKDLNRLFRNPILLKIHACIIRGPNGADGLFDGKSKRPTAKTVERMYKIRCTTPGAIANAACLAIWLHSADTQLVEVGDETAINYRERHMYYLQRILDGLANDKAWAVSLFTHWDHILFPDADKPHESVGSTRNRRLEADEDDEDFFGSAAPTRPATSPPPTPQDSTPQNSSPTAPANPRRSPSPTVPILTQSASHRRSDRGRASSESPAPTPSTSNNAPVPNDRPQLPVPSTSNPAPAPNNNTPAPTIRPRPQRQGKAVYRR
ncbi:hypothetical protein C8J57DRAFT_1376700 [Mycena rebaudengoi]|nr:hypothetical protein C8J57DRAFT_1376700 [Mycena rebaudengoi]